MKTIWQFKEETDQLPPNGLLKHVEYYRTNGDLIFAIDETQDKGHYNAKTKLLGDYGMALADNQNFLEAYPILLRAIELMDNDPYEVETEEKQPVTYYQHLLFRLGVTTYYTKKHSESKSTFTTLLELDPTNDKYRSWLEGLKISPLNATSNVLGWIFLAIVIIKIILPEDISTQFGRIYYPTLVVFGLTFLLIQGLKWNIKSKLKTTSTNRR